MNKVKLIQLRLALAAGALMLLSPGRLGAQAPPSTQASSPQPSPTASPTPTVSPCIGNCRSRTSSGDGDVVDALGTPIQPRTVGVEVDCKF